MAFIIKTPRSMNFRIIEAKVILIGDMIVVIFRDFSLKVISTWIDLYMSDHSPQT